MSVSHTITGGLVHLSGNPIQITLTASAARLNHKLALRVTCKSMAGVELFGSPFTEEIAPKNLVSVFDISGLVDFPADYGFNFPITGGCNPHDLLSTVVTFEVGEIWTDANGDRQTSFTAASDTLRVLKGRLRPYELALLNEAGKSFASEYIDGGKFLTNLPDYQKVGPYQVCMLWFLGPWPGESHVFYMNLKIATDQGREIHKSFANTYWSITGLLEFEFARFHQDFLDEFSWGEKHLAYDFWLSNNADGTDEVSEHRHYIIDYSYYEQSVYLYAVNPLSGIDMYWFRGEQKQGLTTELETAVRPVPVGSGTKVASVKTINTKSQRTWEINTGFRSRDEMLSLRDLLESKQIWIVDAVDSRLMSVTVEAGDFTLFDSMEDLNSLEIKVVEAHV